jgi:hypothetical protein
MPGKMVVDFLRPEFDELETMGLTWPRFDELTNADPALENYDYIFLNNSALMKTRDVIIGQSSKYEYPEEPPRRREYASSVPRPRDDDYERWDRPIANDGGRPMSETRAVKSSSTSQKKTSLGTTLMTEHQLLLMFNRVPAFSTSTKRWRMCSSERYGDSD